MRFPTVVRALEKARRRPLELRQIGPTVSGEVEELQSSARNPFEGRLRRHNFKRRKFGRAASDAILLNGGNRAEIAFVKPCIGLFAQDARYAVAIQIYPLVIRAIQTRGQI